MNYQSILPLLFALWMPSLSVADENAKPLPEFEKLLPSEKFFNKEPLPVGHTYGFATNKNMEGLKKLLLKALGDGWKLKIASPDYVESFNKGREMKMEAIGSLSHDDFSGHLIQLSLVSIPENSDEEFQNFKSILSIVTVDLKVAANLNSKEKKKADQKKEEAEKPAPAPKPAAVE